MSDKKRVFISWSGDYTKAVAVVLKEWLEDLFDRIETFVSDRDIEAGQRSLAVIEEQLRDTSFGLVLVTNANQDSQWINFEAGALSKEVRDSQARVIPVLLGELSTAQLRGPIAQFQAKRFDREGMLDLVRSIGHLVDVKDGVVARRFDRTWDEVERRVRSVPQSEKVRPTRSPQEINEETLTLVRRMASKIDGAFARSQREIAEYQLRRRLLDADFPPVTDIVSGVDADGEFRLDVELVSDVTDLTVEDRKYLDGVIGSVARATGVPIAMAGPWRAVAEMDLAD